jgi:hypothetical protein
MTVVTELPRVVAQDVKSNVGIQRQPTSPKPSRSYKREMQPAELRFLQHALHFSPLMMK